MIKPSNHIGIPNLIKNLAISNKPNITMDPAITTPSDKPAENGKNTPDEKRCSDKITAPILELNTLNCRGDQDLHENDGVENIKTKTCHHIFIPNFIINLAIFKNPKMTQDSHLHGPNKDDTKLSPEGQKTQLTKQNSKKEQDEETGLTDGTNRIKIIMFFYIRIFSWEPRALGPWGKMKTQYF